MERSNEELRSPFHLIHCAFDLGRMAIAELLTTVDQAIVDAWDGDE